MQASIVDLRYHMNDVLKALERNEEVAILYRGKTKGVLTASGTRPAMPVTTHPFFNSEPVGPSVDRAMERLRGGRYRDL